MPLFKCDECGCVENTALGNYWYSKYQNNPVKCSECGKGKWHGKFEKRSANGYFVTNEGFLYSKEEIDHGSLGSHESIIGVVENGVVIAA